MNELARQKLIEAALSGVRQIKGNYTDGRGGFCAMGVLGWADPDKNAIDHVVMMSEQYGLIAYADCPFECGKSRMAQRDLVIHLNDDHDLDFLGIAHKMP